jgi:hypothetical protein
MKSFSTGTLIRRVGLILMLAVPLTVGKIATVSTPALAQSNYGAIATEPGGDAYGFAYDLDSASDAEAAALANCPASCVIQVTFSDGCAAVSRGGGFVASSQRDNGDDAIAASLDTCGSDECELVAWACTTR